MDSLLIAGIPLSLKRRPIEQLSLYQACQDSNLYFSSNACYHWLKLITPKDRSDRAPLFQYLSPPQGRFEILRRFYLRMALKGDAPDYLALFLNHGLNFDTLYPQAVYLGLPYLSDEIVHFLQDLIHPNRNWLELVIRKIEDPNKKQEIVTLYLDKGVQPNIYSVLAAWEAAPELIPQLIGSLPPGTRLEWMTFLVRVDPSITTPEKEQAFPSLASILRMDDLTVMELSDPHEDFQSPHYRWLLPFLQHTPHPDSNCLTVAIRRVEDPPLRQAIVTRYLELAVVPNEDSIVAAWANAPDLIPQLVGSLPSDFQLNLSLLMDNGIRQEITPEREEAFSSLFPMLDGMLILLIYPTWWKMAFKAMCEHSFKAISNLFKSIGEFFVALVSE